VQDEYRRIGSRVVDFFECRHPAFRKLELGPAADNPHPLTGGRALRLLFEHAQGIRERRDAVPSQFHVVIEAAANDVEMRVVESGDDPAAVQADYFPGSALECFRIIEGDDPSVFDSETDGFRVFRVESGDASVVEHEVGKSI
jgi:hypothetical protein